MDEAATKACVVDEAEEEQLQRQKLQETANVEKPPAAAKAAAAKAAKEEEEEEEEEEGEEGIPVDHQQHNVIDDTFQDEVADSTPIFKTQPPTPNIPLEMAAPNPSPRPPSLAQRRSRGDHPTRAERMARKQQQIQERLQSVEQGGQQEPASLKADDDGAAAAAAAIECKNNTSTTPNSLLLQMSNSDLMHAQNEQLEEELHQKEEAREAGQDHVDFTTISTTTQSGDAKSAFRRIPSALAVLRSSNNQNSSTSSSSLQPGAYAQRGRAFGERPAWTRGHESNNNDNNSNPRSFPYQESLRRWFSRRVATNNVNTTNNNNLDLLFSADDAGGNDGTGLSREGLARASIVTDVQTVVYATDIKTSREMERDRRMRVCMVVFGIAGILALIGSGVGLSLRFSRQKHRAHDDEFCRELRGEPTFREACRCNVTKPVISNATEHYWGLLVETLSHEKGGAVLGSNYELNITSCDNLNTALHEVLEAVKGLEADDNKGSDTDSTKESKERNYALIDEIRKGDEPISLLTQHFVLVHFFLEMGGEQWSCEEEDWLRSTNVCDWSGIDCTISNRVIEVSRPANNLVGTIPSQLGALTYLRKLDLSSNYHIKGSIPEELLQIESLRRVVLRHNMLTGSIPTTIGKAIVLDTLMLNDNALSGSIPTEIGQLDRLRALRLECNGLNGTIPTELVQMESLQDFTVHDNNLEGTLPSNLDQMSLLETFNVRNNSFTGSVLTLTNVSMIAFVDLSFNDFTGSLPPLFLDCNSTSPYLDTIVMDCDNFSNETKQACRHGACCWCTREFMKFDEIGF